MDGKQQAEQIKAQVKQMLSGLEGVVKSVESMVEGSFKNMGPDELMGFKKAYKEAKTDDVISNMKKNLETLKNDLKL